MEIIPNYLSGYSFIKQTIQEFILFSSCYFYSEFILMESIIDHLEIKLETKPKKLLKYL